MRACRLKWSLLIVVMLSLEAVWVAGLALYFGLRVVMLGSKFDRNVSVLSVM